MLLSLGLDGISCENSLAELMSQRIQAEHLLESEHRAFPCTERMLGLLKGASGGMSSHTLGACRAHWPAPADRGFPAFQAGMFCLRERDRTVRTGVKDTTTMILGGRERMIGYVRSVTSRALES